MLGALQRKFASCSILDAPSMMSYTSYCQVYLYLPIVKVHPLIESVLPSVSEYVYCSLSYYSLEAFIPIFSSWRVMLADLLYGRVYN